MILRYSQSFMALIWIVFLPTMETQLHQRRQKDKALKFNIETDINLLTKKLEERHQC